MARARVASVIRMRLKRSGEAWVRADLTTAKEVPQMRTVARRRRRAWVRGFKGSG
jgi:hypothetical protein